MPVTINDSVAVSSGKGSVRSLTMTLTSGTTKLVAGNTNADSRTVVSFIWTVGTTVQNLVEAEESAYNSARGRIYYLDSPTLGTGNLGLTLSGAAATNLWGLGLAGAGLGVYATNTAGGYSSAPSVTVAGLTDGMTFDCAATYLSTTGTVGANQTEMFKHGMSVTGAQNSWGGASYETGGGTRTMSWSLGGDKDWAIAAVSFVPPAAGGNRIWGGVF